MMLLNSITHNEELKKAYAGFEVRESSLVGVTNL